MHAISGLIAAALLSAPMPAAAADWWRVVSNESGKTYIDLGSLKKTGTWTRVDQVMVYPVASPTTRVKSVATIVEFDCSRRVARYRLFRAQDDSGAELHNLTDPDQLAEHDAGKNTVGGDALDFVCNISRERAVRVANPFTDR
ncbi:hypothetical protein P1X14_15435 [Sphingomonas sp. AOB5]|uniref:surface-adhesin E family protein n=1 Tax=Sphingomonas sp. AOB5 TaxID=3034017 RepID=UPI0023F7BD9F|nr:surface-adhesin E family protein [Sphingomonas sp. AOB5]MDF7776649.1 hypothetical protein [Sphingomonas sp. AOB5]